MNQKSNNLLPLELVCYKIDDNGCDPLYSTTDCQESMSVNRITPNLFTALLDKVVHVPIIQIAILIILFLLVSMFSLSAQTPRKDSGADGSTRHELKGQVLSHDDKPLQGVSIRVDAENLQIKSANDGTFQVMVKDPKGKVKFTYVGFISQEVRYTAGTDLVIRLIPEDNKLDEVEIVSTGYQKIPKERATGSFEFVDNKLFNRKVSTDFVSRLEDVVPGFTSNKTGNSRGSYLNVNVRGLSTLFSEKFPLIVIDGVPYDISNPGLGPGIFTNINPNDIENVTVLKDAAAASIWGAQSGNGVIVITTKRGKFNEQTKLSFNSNISIKAKPDLYYYPQMGSSDYIDAQQYIFDQGKYNSWFKNKFRNPQPALWLMYARKNGTLSEADFNEQIGQMKVADMRDDFLKYIYRQAVNQQYNIQLQTGSDKVNTLFSVGYDKNLNDVVTSSFKRLNLKSNTQIKPVKNMILDIGLSYTDSKNENSYFPVAYNRMAKGVKNYPYMRLADANGNPLAVDISGLNPTFRDTIAGGRLLDYSYVPLDQLNDSRETQQIREFFANINASYSFDFGLKLNLLYAYQRTMNPTEIWKGIGTYELRDEINSFASWNNNAVTWNLPVGDFLGIVNWDSYNHQSRATADYSKKWNEKHEISLFAGMEVRKNEQKVTSSQYSGYDPETGAFKSVPYGIQVPMLNGLFGTSTITDVNVFKRFRNNFVSYFANGAYTYANRYLLSGSFRKDASNLFGVKSNDRGQPFWSVGAAWILSNEPLLANSVFNFLKLRATYGYNGNVNNSVSAYPIMSIQSEAHYMTNQNYGMIMTPPNPRLRWERIGITNVGLDFSLRNNSLSGSIEYYVKNAKDLIAPDRIDPSTGFSTLMVNSGNIRTKGWDISLNSIPLQRKNWTWSSNLVFSYARTKVLKSYVQNENGKDFISSAQSGPMTPIEGMDLYSQLGYKWAGLDPSTGEPRAYINGEISKDYTAILGLNVRDLENYGSTVPLYTGGWRNSVRYKMVELSWNISYQLGHKFLRNSFDNSLFLNSDIGHTDYALRWQEPGDELHTDVPVFKYPADLGSQVYMRSSALLENGGQIKLRDIQLSVGLPSLSRFKVHNAKVYGYIQNVGTIWRANKFGIDTEYGFNISDPMMSALGLSFNF